MDELREKIRLQQQVSLIENNAKQFLDKAALSRYGNIKIVDPEKALQISLLINQAVQSGALKGKLADNEFKDLLMNLQGSKKEFRFIRK